MKPMTGGVSHQRLTGFSTKNRRAHQALCDRNVRSICLQWCCVRPSVAEVIGHDQLTTEDGAAATMHRLGGKRSIILWNVMNFIRYCRFYIYCYDYFFFLQVLFLLSLVWLLLFFLPALLCIFIMYMYIYIYIHTYIYPVHDFLPLLTPSCSWGWRWRSMPCTLWSEWRVTWGPSKKCPCCWVWTPKKCWLRSLQSSTIF